MNYTTQTHRQQTNRYVLTELSDGSEFTTTDVANALPHLVWKRVANVVHEMRKKGLIEIVRHERGERRPLRYVYRVLKNATLFVPPVITQPNFVDRLQKLVGARNLCDYTDAELLKEVARRVNMNK